MMTKKPQSNARSTEKGITVERRNLFTTNKKNHVTPINAFIDLNEDDSESNHKTKLRSLCILPQCCLSMSPCFQCLLLSILVASLVSIVVIPILVAILHTTSTTTTTSITIPISTVTTTSATTMTATTATSSTTTSSTTSSASTSTVSTTSTTTTTSTSATSSSSSSSTSSTTSTATSTTVTTSTVSTSSTTSVTSTSSTTATTTTLTSTSSKTETTTTSTRSTSTTASTTSTTACLGSYTGNLANVDGGPSFGWTQFANSYIANKTQPYLTFGFDNDNHRQWWLDGVSVVDVTVPSGQLLNNPSFENSTSAITGWAIQQGCCNSNALNINTTGCIVGSNCLNFWCGPENTFSFLGQYFNAIIGHTYNISYYLKTSGTGGQPTFCDVSIL